MQKTWTVKGFFFLESAYWIFPTYHLSVSRAWQFLRGLHLFFFRQTINSKFKQKIQPGILSL